MPVRTGPEATVDPAATLLGNARAYGYCVIGPDAHLEGNVLVKDDAQVDNCTIVWDKKPGLVIAGDALIESDADLIIDEDDVAEFAWAVYKTARTHVSGKHIWQASAGCVTGIDMTTVTLDWHDVNVFKGDAGRYVGHRTAQLARVRAQIAQRGGHVGG